MNIYKVEPPFAVQIEPVEGCSLACSFCGIQTIRYNGADALEGKHGQNSAPYRFMTLDTAKRIAVEMQRLAWNSRIELAMHGEPSMHPQLGELIYTFRKYLPRAYIMVTSNGSGLMKKPGALIDLFDKGLNTLALDDYKHSGFVTKMRPWLQDAAVEALAALYEYPAEKDGNPHKRTTGRRITILHDISDNTDGTHQLTNQGGNSGAREVVEQRCAKPFRELSVRWDGNVALCCDDWKGQYKIGNVNDMQLNAIWHHPRFEAARRRLYAAKRDFGPCDGCNVRTYRNGLLPDKLGQDVMKPPNEESDDHIRDALRGKVFTIKLRKGD